jgi:hypothetical protein
MLAMSYLRSPLSPDGHPLVPVIIRPHPEALIGTDLLARYSFAYLGPLGDFVLSAEDGRGRLREGPAHAREP